MAATDNNSGSLMLSCISLALVLGLLLAACSPAPPPYAGPAAKASIACATPPYTVLVDLALSQGYFHQEGIELTPHFFTSGKSALEELLAGRADFATVAETPTMFAIMRGEPIAIIATIQSSSKNCMIMARRDRGITVPDNLRGKRIGLTTRSISDFYLDTFLAINGIGRHEVTLVDLMPEEMPRAMAEAAVDAVCSWPPYLTQIQADQKDNGIILSNEDIHTQTFNIVARQDYIQKSPETVKRLLSALARAEKYAKLQPDRASDSVARFRSMDRTLIKDMWRSNRYTLSLEQNLVLALESESKWAIRNNLTTARHIPNYLDYIYLDGLASTAPDAVKILR